MSKGLFGAIMEKYGFWRGLWIYINIGPELKPGDLDELGKKQDAVMQYYKDKGWVLIPLDEEGLHMFFSPSRVPEGLNEQMVRVCILLYPLRRRQNVLNSILNGYLAPVMRPISLPSELHPLKPMTKWRFKRGIFKFLLSVAAMEIAATKAVRAETEKQKLSAITDEPTEQKVPV